MSLIVSKILDKQLFGDLSFDNPLPLSVLLNESNEIEGVLHYEIITESDSFFEIEILKQSGKIKSILLTNYNEKDLVVVRDLEIEKSKIVKGELIIDTSIFNTTEDNEYFGRFKREKGFTVIKAKNGVRIKLENKEPAKFIEIYESCFFGISDKNQILNFTIINIDENQLKQFSQSIC